MEERPRRQKTTELSLGGKKGAPVLTKGADRSLPGSQEEAGDSSQGGGKNLAIKLRLLTTKEEEGCQEVEQKKSRPEYRKPLSLDSPE